MMTYVLQAVLGKIVEHNRVLQMAVQVLRITTIPQLVIKDVVVALAKHVLVPQHLIFVLNLATGMLMP
jgi:hypothetical protein